MAKSQNLEEIYDRHSFDRYNQSEFKHQLDLIQSENRQLLAERTEMFKRLLIYKNRQKDLERLLNAADEKIKRYEEPQVVNYETPDTSFKGRQMT